MSAVAIKLLAECKARGISLRHGENGKLKVSPPPERLPAELREALRQHKAEVLAVLQQQKSAPSVDYQSLYREMAATAHDDCFLMDPTWLLDHPEVYAQIRDLDDALTSMECEGADEDEYCRTLARLMKCIQEARSLCAKERTQSAEVVQ